MVYLEKMKLHTVTGGNYVTSVNGMVHPDRIMKEHDFLYLLDGNWEISEDGICYSMKTDDLLILPAGRHHYGEKLCNAGNRHMYLHILPTEAERCNRTDCFPPTCPDTLFCCPSLLHCNPFPRVRQYMQEMISLSLEEVPEQQNRSSLLFSLLLCELSAMYSDNTQKKACDSLVEEVSRLIRSTPQTFFTPKEISQKYQVCERTINNRFYKCYGKTFLMFQMETKLDMVRQFLLSQPDTKLVEAALNYGFYDEFHLSKAFKKRFGVSPSRYRKEAADTLLL